MNHQHTPRDDARIIALFDEHRAGLERFFLGRLQISRIEAQELVQDTYVLLVGQAQKKEISAWPELLWCIALSVANNKFSQRKARRAATALLEIETREHRTPETSLIEQETMAEIRRAVDELPERKRLVLMNSCEGKPFKQIAHELDISERTCSRDFADAIAGIRRQIGLG